MMNSNNISDNTFNTNRITVENIQKSSLSEILSDEELHVCKIIKDFEPSIYANNNKSSNFIKR